MKCYPEWEYWRRDCLAKNGGTNKVGRANWKRAQEFDDFWFYVQSCMTRYVVVVSSTVIGAGSKATVEEPAN